MLDGFGSLRAYFEGKFDYRGILNRVGGYLEELERGAQTLYENYRTLDSEDRDQITEGVISAATLLVSSLYGHPLVGITLLPLVTDMYRAIKERDIVYVKRGAERLYSALKEKLLVEDTSAEYEHVPEMALATIIALSILGLGFSWRLGTEITGKIGAVSFTPFVLIFFIILVTSVAYTVRIRKK